MKKLQKIAVFVCAIAFSFLSTGYAGESGSKYELNWWQDKLIMYVPNRVMDVLDIFSLSVGAGPVVGIDARVTRAITAGAGVGAVAKLEKGYNRQYGAVVEDGYNIDFLFLSAEKKETVNATRFIKRIDVDRICAVWPNDEVYDFYEGARDYWSVGVSLAAIVDIDFDIHPVEILDMLTGFFFIDLKGDDLEVYDVANTREIDL